jgi:hypothetical protein
MRVLVCGGRTWGWCRYDAAFVEQARAQKQRQRTYDVLDRLDMACGIDLIIHGDARGADRVAGKWAERNRCPVQVYPANWLDEGRAAGPLRNSRMLAESRPDLVVAFPGGTGTADMLGKAIDADDVEVLDLGGLDDARSLFDTR